MTFKYDMFLTGLVNIAHIPYIIYVKYFNVSYIDICAAKKSQILNTTESGFGGG